MSQVPAWPLPSSLSNHMKTIRLEMWPHRSLIFLKRSQIRLTSCPHFYLKTICGWNITPAVCLFFFMCMIWSLLQLHCWVWLIRCTNDLEYFARLWQKAGVIVVLSMYVVYTLNICVLAEQTHLLLSVSHVLWWLHSCSLLHSALVICLLMLAVSTIFSTILLLQLLPSCCSVQSFGGVAVV